MEFKHLRAIMTHECTECGCNVVVRESIDTSPLHGKRNYRVIRTHVNGERWETREFLCGGTVSYVPNYSKVIRGDGRCQENEEAIKLNAEKLKIRLKMRDLRSELADLEENK
jgi:superfamily I DNA and RNA helicase